jgi:hypothetical protein
MALAPSRTFNVEIRATGRASMIARAAVASLPGHFRLGEAADVVVINGAAGAWPSAVHAVIKEGFHAVVVADRALAPIDEARMAIERAEEAGIALVFDTPFANSAAWQVAFEAVRNDATKASVIDSVVTWPAGERDDAALRSGALLDQLAVVRPLLGRLESSLRSIHTAAGGFELVAADVGVATLTGVRAPERAHRLDLDIVAAGPRWRVRFDAGAPASPVVISVHDDAGVRERPLLFEGAARATWMSLYTFMTDPALARPDLAYLVDLELADRLLPRN